MERFAQYWDDLDDLIGMIGLCIERIRRLLMFLASTLLILGTVIAAILIALMDPPLALAIATILAVQLGYSSVTGITSQRAAA